MRKRLESLGRRLVFCTRGTHRETVIVVCGRFTYRCVDCSREEVMGHVFLYGSNRKYPKPTLHESDDS